MQLIKLNENLKSDFGTRERDDWDFCMFRVRVSDSCADKFDLV